MGLIDRVKNILLTPATEWPAIVAEPVDLGALYSGYVAPLALIPAVCVLLGTLRADGLSGGVLAGVEAYVLNLVAVYVAGFAVAKAAPAFGAGENLIGALKLVAYSWTAYWVAAIFLLVPSLNLLRGLGLFYSFYLLYLGIPAVLQPPQSATLPLAVAAAIIEVVVLVVLETIRRELTPAMLMF